MFRQGLNDIVRDAFVTVVRPKDLLEMIDRAIELDTYQRERQQKPARSSLSPPRLSPHRKQPSMPLVRTNTGGEEPMLLGGTCLSPAEWRRWFMSDSCLYCGETGHFIVLPGLPKRPG